MTDVAAFDQVALLLLIVFCLGSCLVRAFWELEQLRPPDRCIAPPPHKEA
ncbi:hypothetical protein [Bradyrhizobium cajani]|nr:hypothetical protein [Bradyrhizobium cajani]MCP3374376.1 hypothetical protein [Bradyrhizobium cajani]